MPIVRNRSSIRNPLNYMLAMLLLLSACKKEEILPDCAALPDTFNPNELQSLFIEVGLGQEFGQDSPRLRKWNSEIRIFMEGALTDTLVVQIEAVIAELSALSTFIEIKQEANIEDSNCRLFLGRKEDYVESVEPKAIGIAEGNSGFATIAWNNQNEIIRASACLDVLNYADAQLYRHILREELAQILGLINDTESDDNSIFYQFNSSRTSYSAIDRQLIAYMLGNELKPGMCKSEIMDIVK